jgi:CRISPR/Cas system-associated endonuclease Cas1
VQLRSNRLFFVTNEERHAKAIKEGLSVFAHTEIFSFDSLCYQSTRAASGRTIVLVSPEKVIEGARAKGITDAGIAKVLAGRLWRGLVVVQETEDAVRVPTRMIPQPHLLLAELANSIHEEGSDSTTWLVELLLSLLYRRHLTVPDVLRILPYSSWWYKFQSQGIPIDETLRRLVKENLVKERKGRYTCTRQGMLLVEREIPYSQAGLGESRTFFEREQVSESKEGNEEPPEWWKEEKEQEKEDIIRQLITEFVENHDWITVKDADRNALDRHAIDRSSTTRIRRILEEMVKEKSLTRLIYVRGVGRPVLVYRKRGDGDELAWLESRCGDCAFYVNTHRRCRLWWAVNRFDGNAIHSRWDQLPRMAHEKLRYGISGMGPKATACDYFAPKNKDFPVRNAPEECLGCGTTIDVPLAKVVQCAKCGTRYKPVKDRILVLYNYEQIFSDRYSKIVGVRPPSRALAIRYPEENEHPIAQRDLIVLYPAEKVLVGPEGITVRKEGVESFQPYTRTYAVVDYGALSDEQVASLQGKRLSVFRRSLVQNSSNPSKRLPPDFSEKLGRFRDEDGPKVMAESLIRSAIIATRRILTIQGRQLQPELVSRQLLEYARFKQDSGLRNLDVLLAYEARVSQQYWKAYKLRLRIVGLDFKSRVRDRFVREIVLSVRARARGYSVVNAGVNYLHQRRLLKCRLVNARLGLSWDGFEGIIHVARRRQAVGLMLDLSDQFKLADREILLDMCAKQEITQDDFMSAGGRQGVRFYFPSDIGIQKLERVGQTADQLLLFYNQREMPLMEAYEKYVESFIAAVESQSSESVLPITYGLHGDYEWLQQATASL